jgi:uncharacterized membrane protein
MTMMKSVIVAASQMIATSAIGPVWNPFSFMRRTGSLEDLPTPAGPQLPKVEDQQMRLALAEARRMRQEGGRDRQQFIEVRL